MKHNRVSMPALRELFVDLGAEDVSTYVQSGNVIFRQAGSRAALVRRIENEMSSRLGVDVTVLLRTKAELARLVAGSPYADKQHDPKKLHVTFLAKRPQPARVRALAATQLGTGEFHVSGAAVYLHLPDGYHGSKLSNTFLEKQLGVAATTRNWRTVTTLAELAAK